MSGTIVSSATRLPGVVVSVVDTDGQTVATSASGVDGAFIIRIPGAGHYALKATLVAFAPVSRDLVADPANCQVKVELVMTLASRAPRETTPAPLGATPTPGRGQLAPRCRTTGSRRRRRRPRSGVSEPRAGA